VKVDLPRTVRLHDLRHTCATLLLGKGVHPKIVQELLGHATIAITLDTYSHVLPNMQGEATHAMESVLS
jgi:integrase